MRYLYQAEKVKELGLQQLNLEKNRIKPDFEYMPIDDIWLKLEEELLELKMEIVKNKNLKAIFSELGDCIAVLVGLYAYFSKEEKNDDAET